jgi:hypothetical protein
MVSDKLKKIVDFSFRDNSDKIELRSEWLFGSNGFNAAHMNQKLAYFKLILELFESVPQGQEIAVGVNGIVFKVSDLYLTLNKKGDDLRLWCGDREFSMSMGTGSAKHYENLILQILFSFPEEQSYKYNPSQNLFINFIQHLGYYSIEEGGLLYFRKS